MKDVRPGVDELNRTVRELFSTYRFTGERQKLLAGMFGWLRDNGSDPMSPGEVRTAVRMGFPEVLREDVL